MIDLHGRLDLMRCMACSLTLRRADFQDDLLRLNASWADLDAAALPDGDAGLDHMDFSGVHRAALRVLRRREETGRRVLRRKRSAASGL